MRIFTAASIASLAMALGLSAPAAAQEDAGADDYRVNQLIIYGSDECPVSTASEITVCARKDEGERYRIPEDLRLSEDPANTAWTERVLAYETVGSNGINSCSPVGGGGELGCTQQLIDRAAAERKESSSIRFSELIAKAREERMSGVDAEAAAAQARVEEEEAAYFERKAAEDAAGPVELPAGADDGTAAYEPAE